MIAQLIGQSRFGSLWLSLGMVTPVRQFIGNEFKKFIGSSSRQMNLRREPACAIIGESASIV